MSSVAQKTQALSTEGAGVRARSALYVDEGTIQALKWIGLLLMFVDHTNKYLALGKIEWMFAAGRACLPIFCFVLAYNLSRRGVLADGGFMRALKRMAISGTVATPFFIMLGGLGWGWWPLNIMFMLFAATWILFLLERRQRGDVALAVAVFTIGGAFVEFWWVGLLLCLAARHYCKQPTTLAFAGMVVATGALYLINGNGWALAALPLIAAAPYVHEVGIPRWRNLFYIAYPTHLALLVAIRWWFNIHW